MATTVPFGDFAKAKSLFITLNIFKVKLPNVLVEDSPMIIYEFNKANTELELSDIYN